MPVIIRNKSYDIALGHSPIEKMGGDNVVTYSMYGDEIPLILEDGEVIVKVIKSMQYNLIYLTDKGNLYGAGNSMPLGLGTEFTTEITLIASNVKDFITYSNVTFYINNNNELYGCGYNTQGEQGSGDKKNVLTFTKRAENVKLFSFDYLASLYINHNNELYVCGNNYFGQLGTGDTENVLTFTKIELPKE